MLLPSAVLAVVSALEHVWFAVLEMVLWQRPIGLRIFGNNAQKAAETRVFALNQGLYNLFLAGGLVGGAALPGPVGSAFRCYFFICVVAAGVVGAASVNRRILYVQAAPAAVGLVLMAMGR